MTQRVIFVHGTGVRQSSYEKSFALVEKGLHDFSVERCFWAGAYGTRLLANGASVPAYSESGGTSDIDAELERCQWRYLYDDPLHELRVLVHSDTQPARLPPIPGSLAPDARLARDLEAFAPSEALKQQLRAADLIDLWATGYETVVRSQECNAVVAAVGEDSIVARRAIARAIIAKCSVLASTNGLTISGRQRDAVLALLTDELDGIGRGWLANLFLDQLKGVATNLVTRKISGRRGDFSDMASPFAADILAYQSRSGSLIRRFIRDRITAKPEPAIVIAHSLGGIASFDLLVDESNLNVSHLITIGTQASLFYELDILSSLRFGDALPTDFPAWLNIYDRDDFLSYLCATVFGPAALDVEAHNGVPFPESHSAYWSNDEVWKQIREFVA